MCELDPKLKQFWKDNALKFNIGDINVEECYFLYHKTHCKVNSKQQQKIILSSAKTKKFNIYTSYIKVRCIVFLEQF